MRLHSFHTFFFAFIDEKKYRLGDLYCEWYESNEKFNHFYLQYRILYIIDHE